MRNVVFLLMFFFVFSCKKEKVFIDVSTTVIRGTSFEAFMDTVQIRANGKWYISGQRDWCHVSSENGTGNSAVIISVDENKDADLRTLTLRIAANNYNTKEIYIIQPGNESASIDTLSPINVKQEGYCLALTGISDYMIVDDDPAFNIPSGQSFSISLKIRSDPQSGGYRILNRRDGTGTGYELITNSSGDVALNMRDDNNTNLGTTWGTTGINDGKWHHVAAVFNVQAKSTYLFVDGVREGQLDYSTKAYAAVSLNKPLLLGVRDINGDNQFSGYIDDVRFWKKSLTKEEVYADAQNKVLASDADDLIAGWDFEKDSSGYIPDVTSNYAGKLVNGAHLTHAGSGFDELLENEPLFPNGTENNHTYYYRCPSIVTAINGDIVAADDQRVDNRSDVGGNPDINIVVRRSSDNGATWSDAEVVADYPRGESISDPAMVVDKETGTIFLFATYVDQVGDKGKYLQYLFISKDNGKSWTQSRNLTPQLLNGRWPNDFKFTSSGRALYTKEGKIRLMLSKTGGDYMIGSDDQGKNWFYRDVELNPANEAKIVELEDGSLMINTRTNAGYRYVYTSKDDGATWNIHPEPGLPDPGCNAGFIRYTLKSEGFSENRLLFSNCNDPELRDKLTVRVSYDEGTTWSAGKLIAAKGGYSSMTILKDGTIGLAYENGSTGTKFARFSLQYLTNGQDSLKYVHF